MSPSEAAARPQDATATVTSSDPHYARRWLILVVIGLAQLMVVLDATIVNIALPTAQQDLGFSTGDRQWVLTAYALAFGSLLPLGGRVADLFGRKRAFLTGLAGFAVASAVGGAASSFGMLIAARAAQGMFAALLAPAGLSLLITTFTDAKERGRAFGIYGAIAGGGTAVGLLLGGVLTEYLNWRWCLYVNIIFVIVALVGGARLLRHQPSEHRPKLDIPGVLSASAGLFCLVYGFSQAQTHDWSSASVWGFLLAGVALLALFVALQAYVKNPLLPLRVLLDRNRGGALTALFLLGIGIFAVFLFLTFYLQQNLDFSPVESGLAFLPVVVALMAGSTVGSALLLPRTGPKITVPAGLLVAAGGLFWLSGLKVDSTYAGSVLLPLIVTGLGLGLGIAPSMNLATSGVEADDAGVAAATVNTAQQIGGSLGTALLSSIAASAASSFLTGKTPSAQLQAEAAVHSYTAAFAWSAGILLAGVVVCGLLFRPGLVEADETALPL